MNTHPTHTCVGRMGAMANDSTIGVGVVVVVVACMCFWCVGVFVALVCVGWELFHS